MAFFYSLPEEVRFVLLVTVIGQSLDSLYLWLRRRAAPIDADGQLALLRAVDFEQELDATEQHEQQLSLGSSLRINRELNGA